MDAQGGGEVWTTISFDKNGNIVEFKNRKRDMREGRSYGNKPGPEEGGKCPEGESEITAVKTIEVTFVTCGDTSDPCWIYNPGTRRWYWNCD